MWTMQLLGTALLDSELSSILKQLSAKAKGTQTLATNDPNGVTKPF